MINLPISEVRVLVCQPDGTWPALPVEESPYYVALAENSFKAFYHYKYGVLAKHSPESFKKEGSYPCLMRLYRSIGAGFDPSPQNPIKFDEDGRTALDGQHRLAILRHLHGPNLLMEVENNEVVGIKRGPSI